MVFPNSMNIRTHKYALAVVNFAVNANLPYNTAISTKKITNKNDNRMELPIGFFNIKSFRLKYKIGKNINSGIVGKPILENISADKHEHNNPTMIYEA